MRNEKKEIDNVGVCEYSILLRQQLARAFTALRDYPSTKYIIDRECARFVEFVPVVVVSENMVDPWSGSTVVRGRRVEGEDGEVEEMMGGWKRKNCYWVDDDGGGTGLPRVEDAAMTE
jgi:hypothetical protein